MLTCPVMKTLRLLMALTTTVTVGSSTNFAAAFVSDSRNCSGVNPSALTSLMSGSEIIPSGLTTTSADSSFSRQNTIVSASSGPIT